MRVMLSLLSKVISRQRQRSLSMLKYTVSDSSSTWHDDEAVDVSGILAELSQYSQELPYNFTVPVADFFGDVRVSPEIVHYDNEDGFGLDLQLRHLLNDHLKLDRVRLRLVHSRDPSQDIWLEARDAIDLKRGLIELRLHSEVSGREPDGASVASADHHRQRRMASISSTSLSWTRRNCASSMTSSQSQRLLH